MEILNFPQDQQMEALYSIMGQYPNYLDGLTLVDTPLHYAAAHGRTLLAVEMLQRSPSLGFKLNPAGLSPLHLAIRNGHLETVRSLIRNNPELIGVQGREGITPLHHVAEIGDADLLGEFLMTFPDAIDKLTIRGESAIHLAVKNQKFDSFGVLFGWLRKTGRRNVLRWRDWKDNTLLHVAAETNQMKVIRKIIKEQVPLNTKNTDEKTALDLTTNQDIINLLKAKGAIKGNNVKHGKYSEYFKTELTLTEMVLRNIWLAENRLTTHQRNVILVVAALICAATFQAMVQPPDTGPESSSAEYIFAALNAIAFLTSATMINILIPSRNYIWIFHIGLFCLMIAYAMLVSNYSKHSEFYWLLAVPFNILFMLKSIAAFMVRDVPSNIRDVSPSMDWISMINHYVQMEARLFEDKV